MAVLVIILAGVTSFIAIYTNLQSSKSNKWLLFFFTFLFLQLHLLQEEQVNFLYTIYIESETNFDGGELRIKRILIFIY